MHEHNMNGFHAEGIVVQLVLAVPFIVVACLYSMAVVRSNRCMRAWPRVRWILFLLGIILAVLSVAGPLAMRAHNGFNTHMIGHLLLGMLAPLLIALGRPMTLMLRVLPVRWSRKVVWCMNEWPLKLWVNPVFTGILNIGGIWILYTTRIFALMHVHIWLYVLVHIHVFVAGYLFTVSILHLEPFGVRARLWMRAVVLLIAMALHGILAKVLYMNPPSGVGLAEAEVGAQLMYYGGDLVDAMLIVLLCLEWYRAERGSVGVELKMR